MSEPAFWNDQRAAQAIIARLSRAKNKLTRYTALVRRVEDAGVMIALSAEEEDDEGHDFAREAWDSITRISQEMERFRLELLLRGEYDRGNALLTLHAGAGGTEAQDWVEMLLRMYTRWAAVQGHEIELLDSLEGEEAGLKSATIAVRGENAYGFLRTERGVHRLVRISPYDAQNRRHTTFASLDVTPDVDDQIELDVGPDDLRIETFRAGGRGGQHVNKTESAVKITHLPTGITASCQNERSQHSNRETAMRILLSRILKLREQEMEEEMAAHKGEQHDISWGSQIRSYVFHPYSMVKDHRTGVETGNVQAVMDGDLSDFIFAYLKQDLQSVQGDPGKGNQTRVQNS